MPRLVIYCDESTSRGRYYSNFYGAALLEEADSQHVNQLLRDKYAELNLAGEVKFTKITENYQVKYIELMKTFFSLIDSGHVKVRIMFTQNIDAPVLTAHQEVNSYFLLYYQLLKHAFGLPYIDGKDPVSVRLNLDQLPSNKEAIARFKAYVCALTNSSAFRRRGVSIYPEDISEIVSHKHLVLQCLDVVLGAMQSRLNDGFTVIPAGKRRRAKRTRAKEAVYKAINKEIQKLYPGYQFNVGVTTRAYEAVEYRWKDPYRHWLFKPNNSKRNKHYVAKNK